MPPPSSSQESATPSLSLSKFIRAAWHIVQPKEYVDGFHIGCLAEHLEAVSRCQINKLLINYPPRHSKSSVVSVFWMAWVWTWEPSSQWIFGSYSGSLVTRDALKARDIVMSPWYQDQWGPQSRVRSDMNRVGRYQNEASGYRISTTIRGVGTGEGAEYIVCFPYDTLIETDRGRFPIGRIVDERMPVRILAYDHDSGRLVARSLEAYESNPGRSSVRVAFSNGRDLIATDEHPVFVRGRGYIPAADLCVGDEVVTYEAESNVSGVRVVPRSDARIAGESGPLGTAVVISVERVGTPERVYNVRVAVDHNYFANGVLVHNCDDPLKALDAKSPVEKLRVIDWWTGTMGTRINDPKKTRRVVSQQRLDEGDLSGYLMARGEDYETLILPAKFEKARVFLEIPKVKPRDAIICTSLQRARPELRDPRTIEGEPLWPVRFGLPELKELEREIEGNAPAQLQQRPSSSEGVIFQQSLFRYARVVLTSRGPAYELGSGDLVRRVQFSDCRFFQTIDTAQKIAKANDYMAVGTFAITPQAELIIVHAVQAKIEVPYQMAFLKACRQGPTQWLAEERRSVTLGTWPRELIGQWVEDAASGIGLIQTGLVDGIALRTLSARGDGVERASTLATLYERGAVYHILGASWLGMVEDQLKTFPAAAHDDLVTVCFVKGTMVETEFGSAPIEEIQVHDRVWTRAGLRSVTRSGITGVNRLVMRVRFDDGSELTGTPNHPVWTEDRGFVRLNSISYSDTIQEWENHESRQWSSMVASTGDTRIPSGLIIGDTFSAMIAGSQLRDCYTEMFGFSPTDRFQMDMKSITNMETIPTMTSRICLASHSKSIGNWMRRAVLGRLLRYWRTWIGLAPCEVRSLMRDDCNLPITAGRQLPIDRECDLYAKCAKQYSCPSTTMLSFALGNAQQKTVGIAGSTTGIAPVNGVVLSFQLINTPKQKAAKRVVTKEMRGRADVYNLEVDEHEEYFANGVLVHNCTYAGKLVVTDTLVRAGLAGVEAVAEEYRPNPRPDADPIPWSLQDGETLDPEREPGLQIRLGEGEDAILISLDEPPVENGMTDSQIREQKRRERREQSRSNF